MRKHSPFMQAFDQLPQTLPIFPLNGAVLLPRGNLPLNIFEPRYLNMLRDAMGADQLIGMIQVPQEDNTDRLFDVGCAGRITRYEETDDGRLEIVLTGACRFKIIAELTSVRGYRLVTPDWSDFALDYQDQAEPDSQSTMLFKAALRNYFRSNKLQTDWQVIDKLSGEDLSNSLFSYLPLTPEDKQILIEAETTVERMKAFTAILQSQVNLTSANIN